MPKSAPNSRAQMLRELHEAPHTEEISQTHEWVLARSRYSKDAQQDRYSMHFYSSSHALEGITVDDVAQQLGFITYAPCQFVHNSERICFSREVKDRIDIPAFSVAFQSAYRMLKHIEGELQVCGIDLHLGTTWESNVVGDGHHVTQMNRWLEEDNKDYKSVVVRVESGGVAGWITHYRFSALSPERAAALSILGFQYCESCGQFDFEPCYWMFTQRQHHGLMATFYSDGPLFQKQFHAQRMYLVRGIDTLVEAHRLLGPFGMPLLSLRSDEDKTSNHRSLISDVEGQYPYDVAISFAGADREHARELTRIIKAAGYTVFYDEDEDLWGVDLAVYLSDVYATKARFCIVFVSPEYVDGKWTVHEFNNALARAIDERGQPYILPIVVRDATITGLRPTIAYERIGGKSTVQDVAEKLIKKLK